MWEASVDGRRLNFHLAGINNQNFIMQDEETGTWWQQVTGEAILGALKGRRLKPVYHDELSFALWKRERPEGRVLRPSSDETWRKFSADWETKTAKLPVNVETNPDSRLPARALVVGVALNGASRAYPVESIERQSPLLDTLGDVPLMLVLGDDKKSVRAFKLTVDGQKLELFAKPDVSPLRLVDAATGSEWDFTGKAISGSYAGRQLEKIPVLKDYWFDWFAYNPQTSVYKLASR